jgi:uncharacterized protein (DUF3820 family)
MRIAKKEENFSSPERKDQMNEENIGKPDAALMLELAKMRMPFGKYKGRFLIDLPEPYVVWFSRKGFPPGKLGDMLRTVYEIKVNGLEYLFNPLRNREPK